MKMLCFMLSIFLFLIRLSIQVEKVTVNEGQTAILTCNYESDWYQWFRVQLNSNYRQLNNGIKYDGVNDNSLTIRNTEIADEGRYVCQDHIGYLPPILLSVEIVNGNWTQWTEWGGCTQACGQNNHRFRLRHCNNPPPSASGQYCIGDQKEKDYHSCTSFPCPVDGNWGNWNGWSECSTTCGQSTKSRNRFCNNPAPSNRGSYCSKDEFDHRQTSFCPVPGCPVDGMWNNWLPWSECSSSCGNGTKLRKRRCNRPPPKNNGKKCQGNESDQEVCREKYCPVDGLWADWSKWSTCTVSCGGGNKTRNRTCTNPEPAHSGKNCFGFETELGNCSIEACKLAAPQTSAIGPATGGIAGGVIIVLVMVVISFVIFKRRKKESLDGKTKSPVSKPLERIDETVLFRPDPESQDRTYLNIVSTGGMSCTDTDDDEPTPSIDVTSKSTAVIDPDNVYYNVSLDESGAPTNIKVDELGAYINQREIEERLQEEYKTIPYGAQYPTTMATTKVNLTKNRFKTTFPYDHSRVVLHNKPDYINANYVDGFETEKCYIASQGPTKNTVADHWRMIWQLNIYRIVMLTNLVEGGKRKCEQYWPDGNKPTTCGNLILTLLSEKTRAAYVTREISVEDKQTKEKRAIIQFHFTSWPDHGTPDPLYLVLFHRHVISEKAASNSGPLLVHCSAGIGRTGTYIGLDALYEQGKTTGFIDVAAFVKKMRYFRMNMVQTPEQYVCLHGALHEAFTMKDTNIKKHNFGDVWREIVSDQRPFNHQRLREEFKMLEEKKQEHSKTEQVVATSAANKDKNRNKSVLPADRNRIYLSSFEKGRTDYINAVQVPSYTKLAAYVTTQLPLPNTKVDFWTMVRDQDSSIVVLFLNNHKEAEFMYSTSKSTGSLGSNTLKISNTVEEESGIKIVSLTLSKKDDRPRDIVIYQLAIEGIPDSSVLCKLTNLMSTRISMSESPVTIVSSDGASICGLFCTFTNAVSSMTIDENADIFQLARLLQLRRPEFFKDFEEYRKVYEAVNYYLESTNVYANY